MDTYHAAYWSSDPSRLSSSDEEEDDRDSVCACVSSFSHRVTLREEWILSEQQTAVAGPQQHLTVTVQTLKQKLWERENDETQERKIR